MIIAASKIVRDITKRAQLLAAAQVQTKILRTLSTVGVSAVRGRPRCRLCLYNRRDMPLAVIAGALSTHPVVGTNGNVRSNPFYDGEVNELRDVHDVTVGCKRQELSVG